MIERYDRNTRSKEADGEQSIQSNEETRALKEAAQKNQSQIDKFFGCNSSKKAQQHGKEKTKLEIV